MPSRQVIARIQAFNQGRDPEMLGLKYKAMRTDAFAFFRGTCHLFYEDLPADAKFNDAPAVWVCGDLHLQNFGSFKGSNRLVYFDINDFDESALAPCTWDLARMLTSIRVGAATLAVDDATALGLARRFLDSYTAALASGHAGTVERDTAQGMVGKLLRKVQDRQRPKFLDERTEVKGRQRRFIRNHPRLRPVSAKERSRIEALTKWWAETQRDPRFFTLLDVARRIAGTGSLGGKRYALLVEGRGSPDQNFLLDLKPEQASALTPFLKLNQPKWKHEAERVAAVQQRMQGTAPALMAPIKFNGVSFLLRELQPSEDRVNFSKSQGKLSRLERVLVTMGEVTAWDQVRSGGRQGSAIADELIAFAKGKRWQRDLLSYARAYGLLVEADYAEFCRAFDQGELTMKRKPKR